MRFLDRISWVKTYRAEKAELLVEANLMRQLAADAQAESVERMRECRERNDALEAEIARLQGLAGEAKTDKQRLIELLESFGIDGDEPGWGGPSHENRYRVQPNPMGKGFETLLLGRGDGYGEFQHYFSFDADGKFIDRAIAE